MEEIQITGENDTRIFAWGSAEFDQYDTGDEDKFESKKPVLIPFFSQNSIHIHKLACGAQHSIALTTEGKIYTWGCFDEGALGREQGGKIPGLVDLDYPMDLISAGDSHSVCANSENGILYSWGVYRSVISGTMSKPMMFPTRTGENEFKRRRIQKVLSGENHTMVLSDEKVFVWGDPDTFVLGRMPLKRRKFTQSLKVGGLGYRKVVDIFTGGNHCFLVNERMSKSLGKNIRCVYAWGLNNYGQLGVGNKYENTFKAIEISTLRDKPIKKIVGGEHHTLFLLDDGTTYGCGKNDYFQLGQLDDTDYQEKHSEIPEKERESKTAIYYPTKINFESKISDILACSNYSYAIEEDHKIRTWGLGFSYVLANGKEDEIKEPHTINPNFLKNKVGQLCLGSNHVLFTAADQDFVTPPLQDGLIAKQSNKRGRKRRFGESGGQSGKMSEEGKNDSKEVKKSLKDDTDEELSLKKSSQERENVDELIKPLKRGKPNEE